MKEYKFGYPLLRIGMGINFILQGVAHLYSGTDIYLSVLIVIGIGLTLGFYTFASLLLAGLAVLLTMAYDSIQSDGYAVVIQMFYLFLLAYLLDNRTQNIYALDNYTGEKKIGF